MMGGGAVHCLIHSSNFFNLSASVPKSGSSASAILWSQQLLSVTQTFQCSLLSSTAGALNAAHEKNKGPAVPTWSFCKILGSVGKQGQGRKRRIPIDFGAKLGDSQE